MRTTIDAAARLTLPASIRHALGYAPGTELELHAVDGRLEISLPSRVRMEEGPHGLGFVADDAEPLTSEAVRALVDNLRERSPL